MWDLEQLWCSLMEFAILRNIGQVRNRGRFLNFRKADFQLFRDIVSAIPWVTTPRDKGTKQGLADLQGSLLLSVRVSGPWEPETGQGGPETGMAELGIAGQTKRQEANAQAVGTKTCNLGKV